MDLPLGRKFVGNKWVSKLKNNNDGLLENYKYHFVEKGYVHKSYIEYNEIFSLLVKLTTVRILLALVETYMLILRKKFIWINLRVVKRQENIIWFVH